MALYFGRATSITLRTLPYIFMRLLVYFIFGLLFTLYWVLVYFIGQGAAAIHEYARVGVWIVALILPFPLIRFFREYFLYVLKAGHVAVIAQLAMKGRLPEGVGQIEWGKKKVMETFKETSVLFLVDRLVTGVIRTINGIMTRIGNLFSGVPGMEGLMKMAKVILKFSLTYVDEAILARNFLRENESAWESARSGVVLYAQIWKEVLKTAFFLGVIALISYGVLLILLIIPALGMAKAFPSLKVVFIIAAFIFAAVIKLALLDPWAMTSMILTYLHETEGKVPDRTWEEKIEALSGKFKEIKQKALAEKPAM